MNIRNRPARLRRVQLSVPGSSEKMLQKAAGSDADHVFCDLEDAVAPSAKPGARELIATALNELDWGKKTRCVRINDVTTQWCHDDIITLVEKAGKNIDTIMLTKPRSASDVMFLHLMLDQLEQKLGLKRRIGIEVLIEEVEALQNVEAIATCSDRMEWLIFGMGEGGDYPGDIFHYARFRVTMAARAAGLDAVDGPFSNFKNQEAYSAQAIQARSLGMAGKWAIHPAQIEWAINVFTPEAEAVAHARKLEAAYREAEANGLGAAQVDGAMIDAATVRLVRNTLIKADLIGM